METAAITGEIVAITPSRDTEDPTTKFVTVAIDIADLDNGPVELRVTMEAN